MTRYLAVLFCLLCFASAASAQQPVVTYPLSRGSTNVSGTIAVTNTFQQVAALDTRRVSCTIQNNGAASMWVFFEKDPTATCATNATKAKSVVLTTGQSVGCNPPGVTLTDLICITGTATQEFFAAVQ